MNIWSYMGQWKKVKVIRLNLPVCFFVTEVAHSWALANSNCMIELMLITYFHCYDCFCAMHRYILNKPRQELNENEVWHGTLLQSSRLTMLALQSWLLTPGKQLCSLKLQKFIHTESCRSIMTLKVMTGRHLHQPKNLACFFVDLRTKALSCCLFLHWSGKTLHSLWLSKTTSIHEHVK